MIEAVLAGERQWHIERGHVLDALRLIPDNTVQCVVTSPPYWGLRAYHTPGQVWGAEPDAVWLGELGSEPTIELYIAHLVDVFREVRRVLRPDGICWLNQGDSYAGSGRGPGNKGLGTTEQTERQGFTAGPRQRRAGRGIRSGKDYELRDMQAVDGIEEKNLCLIPERLAIALQEDGWYVRSRIAWAKLSVMPESVHDRPTSSWEHIWMLTKKSRYYYDAEAVRSVAKHAGRVVKAHPTTRSPGDDINDRPTTSGLADHDTTVTGANLRNYWETIVENPSWVLGPDPFSGEFCTHCRTYFAQLKGIKKELQPDGSIRRWCPVCGRWDGWLSHFATFPAAIPCRAIVASTSAYGACSQCGAPWARSKRPTAEYAAALASAGQHWYSTQGTYVVGPSGTKSNKKKRIVADYETVGLAPTCHCPDPDHASNSVILDPFSGSGTTGLAALGASQRYIGIELNDDYAEMSERRLPWLFR